MPCTALQQPKAVGAWLPSKAVSSFIPAVWLAPHFHEINEASLFPAQRPLKLVSSSHAVS